MADLPEIMPIRPIESARAGEWRVVRTRDVLDRLAVVAVDEREVVLRREHLELAEGRRLDRRRDAIHVPRAAGTFDCSVGLHETACAAMPSSREVTIEPCVVELDGRRFACTRLESRAVFAFGAPPPIIEVATVTLCEDVPIDGVVKRSFSHKGRLEDDATLVGFGLGAEVLFGRTLADEAQRLGFDSGEAAEARKPRLPWGLVDGARAGRWTMVLGERRARTWRIRSVDDHDVVVEAESGWKEQPHGMGPRRLVFARGEVPTIESFVLGWGGISEVGAVTNVLFTDETRHGLACERVSFRRATSPGHRWRGDDEHSEDDWSVWLSRDLGYAVVAVEIRARRLAGKLVTSTSHERHELAGYGTDDAVEWGRRAVDVFPEEKS
jgi:hypothetical protein